MFRKKKYAQEHPPGFKPQRKCPNFSEWKDTKTGEIAFECAQGMWDSGLCTPKCAAVFSPKKRKGSHDAS